MSKVVSSTQAKSNLGALLDWAEETGDPVVVEKRGHPVAAIVPYKVLQELEEGRERLRRYEARERLRELRVSIAGRNQDLDPSRADALGEELVKGGIDAMMRSGKLRFEE